MLITSPHPHDVSGGYGDSQQTHHSKKKALHPWPFLMVATYFPWFLPHVHGLVTRQQRRDSHPAPHPRSVPCLRSSLSREREERRQGTLVGLANAVSASQSLEVIVRIPIRVVDDNGVGGRKIDACMDTRELELHCRKHRTTCRCT